MNEHLTIRCFRCGDTDALTLYDEVDSFALCPDCQRAWGKSCRKCGRTLSKDDVRYSERNCCEVCWRRLLRAGLEART